MKIEIIPIKNEPKTLCDHDKYPVIGVHISNPTIVVLFSTRNTGVVLDKGDSGMVTGEIRINLDNREYRVFDKKVVLSND